MSRIPTTFGSSLGSIPGHPEPFMASQSTSRSGTFTNAHSFLSTPLSTASPFANVQPSAEAISLFGAPSTTRQPWDSRSAFEHQPEPSRPVETVPQPQATSFGAPRDTAPPFAPRGSAHRSSFMPDERAHPFQASKQRDAVGHDNFYQSMSAMPQFDRYSFEVS